MARTGMVISMACLALPMVGPAAAHAVVKADVHASNGHGNYGGRGGQTSDVKVSFQYQGETLIGMRFEEWGGELKSGAGCTQVTPSVVLCRGLSGNYAEIFTSEITNDRVVSEVPARINTRSGNDTVFASGDGTVRTREGDDRVLLTFQRRIASDIYNLSDGLVDGGQGQDTIELLGCYPASRPRDGVDVSLDNVRNDGCSDGLIDQNMESTTIRPQNISDTFEKLVGSPFDDLLKGSSRADVIVPGAGNDLVWGGDSPGAPAGHARPPGDTASYEDRGTPVVGSLEEAQATVAATGEQDLFVDIESLTGGRAADTLAGAEPRSLDAYYLRTLSGGPGEDTLTGGGAGEGFVGGSGIDTIRAGGAPSGGSNRIIEDVAGADAGDTLDGGPGFTWVEYVRPARILPGPLKVPSPIDGVIVSLDREANDGWPGEQDNILRGAVIGSSGSDVIRGNEEGNSLAGGAGRDRIFGLAGKDVLTGGQGDDALDGGDGFDICFGGGAPGIDVKVNCEADSFGG